MSDFWTRENERRMAKYFAARRYRQLSKVSWRKSLTFDRASDNPYLPIATRKMYRALARKMESDACDYDNSAMELYYNVQ